MKRTLLISTIILLSTSLFAIESGSYKSTSKTIQEDSYYFMNLTDWKNLTFPKNYLFTSLENVSMGNFAYATKLKNNNTLMASWTGNLWSDESIASNAFNIFYGFNNCSLKAGASFGRYNYADTYNVYNLISGYNLRAKATDFNFAFGTKNAKNFCFTISGDFVLFDDKDDKFLITVVPTFKFDLTKKKTNKSYLEFTYEGFFWKDSFMHTLNTEYSFQAFISRNFTYGLKIDAPIAITKNITGSLTPTMITFIPVISNGFNIAINEKLAMQAGINSTIPSITIPEKMKMQNGYFANKFMFGFTFTPNSNFKIDGATEISIPSGISLNDLWNASFTLSLQTKF